MTKAQADARWEQIRTRPKSGSRRVMGRVQIRRQIRSAKKELDRALKTKNMRVIKAVISENFGRSGLVANSNRSRGPRMPVGLGSGMRAALARSQAGPVLSDNFSSSNSLGNIIARASSGNNSSFNYNLPDLPEITPSMKMAWVRSNKGKNYTKVGGVKKAKKPGFMGIEGYV